MTFLALNYKIPANPSRYRVAVWKALRELGAVYLQDGVAAVPQQDGMEQALRERGSGFWTRRTGRAAADHLL